jgi:hypothetical protein
MKATLAESRRVDVPRDEMQTTCCYAVQDKTWVSDPDGNEWEVFVVLEDNLPEEVQAASGQMPRAASRHRSRSAEPIPNQRLRVVSRQLNYDNVSS